MRYDVAETCSWFVSGTRTMTVAAGIACVTALWEARSDGFGCQLPPVARRWIGASRSNNKSKDEPSRHHDSNECFAHLLSPICLAAAIGTTAEIEASPALTDWPKPALILSRNDCIGELTTKFAESNQGHSGQLDALT